MSNKQFRDITFIDFQPEPVDDEYCNGVECKYCDKWVDLNLKTTVVRLVMPSIMGTGDILVELFVQFTSHFLRPTDHTTNVLDNIVGITWV